MEERQGAEGRPGNKKDHMHSRNGRITCTRAHEPGVKAKDEAKFKEIKDCPGRNSQSQEHWRKKSLNLSDFCGKSLEKIKSQVFSADTNESIIDTSKSSRRCDEDCGCGYYGPSCGGGCDDASRKRSRDCSPTNTSNGPVVYMTAAKMYTMGGPKKVLPVPIECRMPHVRMLF